MSKKRRDKKRERKKQRERLRRQKAGQATSNPLLQMGADLFPGSPILSGIPGMPKMSDQLVAFIEPYSSQVESREAYKKLLTVGTVAWNMAEVPAEEHAEYVAPMLEVFGGPNTPDARTFLEIVGTLIQRKKMDPRFAQDRRLIVNFTVSETPTGGHLEVMSALLR